MGVRGGGVMGMRPLLIRAHGGGAPAGFNLVVSNTQTDYDLRAKALAAGWDGASPVTLTITSTGVIYATSIYTPALVVQGFGAGITLSLVLEAGALLLGAGGIGLRFKSRNALVMRIDVGFSPQGVHFWWTFSDAFRRFFPDPF